MVTVVVSGYFDPIHVGHIELIRKAKSFGDKLIVIVNNDIQAKLKKGKSFIKQEERIKIIESMKNVDEVVLSIDKDRSVCKTLELINPDIFANGGDVLNKDCREVEICKKLNIEMIDGLGKKIQSSSKLIK